MSIFLFAAQLGSWVLVGMCDVVARRVPNVLILGCLVLQVALLTGGAPPTAAVAQGWTLAVIGFCLGLLVFVPLWRFGAMGAGDVKFLAVLGFALGPAGLLASWLLASLMAGVHAVVAIYGKALAQSSAYMWWQSRTQAAASVIGQRLAPARAWMMARRGSRKGTPYATYLAIGALLWVFVLYDQYQ